jgi:serine/threonine protein kinase
MESIASFYREHLCDEINGKSCVVLFLLRVVTKRSIDSVLNERELLATLRHRFLVNMIYAFQDEDNLYIVMNIMEGGDLRYHLSKMTVFTEGETKFMIASIILSLDYLHSKMVIHRDVKP